MTTEPKHTPSPWHVGMKPGPMVYGPKGEQVADLRDDTLMPEERLANADLICRAPSLLADNERLREALRGVMGLIDSQWLVRNTVQWEGGAQGIKSAVDMGAK